MQSGIIIVTYLPAIDFLLSQLWDDCLFLLKLLSQKYVGIYSFQHKNLYIRAMNKEH